ncbi:hypothetical protein Tco_0793215 [Tanacetum coccineum]
MDDMNIPANDVPAEQAPAIAPPIRTDDQILPDTMCYDFTTGMYRCQLDEQWLNLRKEIIRDALQITPTNDNDPFVAPPSSDTVIEYVNTLGYPSTLKNVSAMPSHHVLQILWGIIHRSNIDYAERIWEEFGTLRSVGKDGREIFGEEGVTESPKAVKVTKPKAAKQTKSSAPKAAKVTKPADDKAPRKTSSQPRKSTPAPTEPSKKDQGKKRKPVKETSDAPSPTKRSKAGKVTKKHMPKGPLQLVDEFIDEDVPEKEHVYGDGEANLQRALELSLKDQGEQTQGPARPVVFREPDSGRFQPLLEAHSYATEPSRIDDSPSLDADLAPTNSEMEFDKEVSGINAGDQDEGQAGPNPGVQDEGQAGSNPGDAAESQPQSSHVVHARPNLEHMDLKAIDASTQQNTKQIDEEFTITAYPNVQENLKLPTKDQFLEEKPQEDEPEKTNTESEVQSMVTVPIHQDTFSVPPMATSVIDLTVSHPVSIIVHALLSTSTATTTSITTTTSLPPPPP